jgi:poly-gamma-glutamate synthesis protein (capsule biosynthesis protein)
MGEMFVYSNLCKKKMIVAVAGDLMMGRGIDQVLDFPGSPLLWEEMADARGYVALAARKVPPYFLEGKNIFRHLSLHNRQDLFIANLETSVTRSSNFANKEIHYRADPRNIYFLLQLQVKLGCPLLLSLANNHVLDFGVEGLRETLLTLKQHGLGVVGAGRNIEEASQPYTYRHCKIYGVCHPSSGVPLSWAATSTRPGVFLLEELKSFHLEDSKSEKVLMIHYGPNWQRRIDKQFQQFCRYLIDRYHFKLIVNTSPHHVMLVERYHNAIICHGVGDFINDYYGIGGHKDFSPEVGEIVRVLLDGNIQVERQQFKRVGFALVDR